MKDTYKNGDTLWYCCCRKKLNCNGSLKVNESRVYTGNEHTCTRDYAKNEVDRVIGKCKADLSKTPAMSITQLYDSAVMSLKESGLDSVANIPTFRNIKSSLYRLKSETSKAHFLEFNLKGPNPSIDINEWSLK